MTINNRVLRRTVRVFLYILLVVFSIVLVTFIFINLPLGKRVVRNQIESFLTETMHTKVEIGRIDYSLPQWIEITDVYIEDQQKDTLAYGEKISADVNMLKLLFGKTDIEKLYFKNILLNIKKKESDSVFNYLFVLDAFTGNKSTTAIPDTAALKITLDKLIFDKVFLRFHDEHAGNKFSASIDTLDASIDKFQPDRVQFAVSDFYAKGVNFIMNTYKPAGADTSTVQPYDSTKLASYFFNITAKKLNLYNVNVSVENVIDDMEYRNDITYLGLRNAVYDLGKFRAAADSLMLDSSYVKISLPRKAVPASTTQADTATSVPWYFGLGQLTLSNSQIEYNDPSKPLTGGFDPMHFNASNIQADVKDFLFNGDTVKALVNNFAFNEKNGFELDSLHINYFQSAAGISAKELYVKTPQTLLRDMVEIKFDTTSATKAQRDRNSSVNANIENSVIAFNDLYQLMPSMKASFPPEKFANLSLRVHTALNGNLAQVHLPYIELSGLTGSSISARGNLYNLSDPDRFAYDLYILKSQISKTDLLKFVPANAAGIQNLPPVFNLSGHIKGNKNDLVADIRASARGLSFNGRIALQQISNPDKMSYDLAIATSDIDRSFILAFMPAGSLPPNIRLPQNIKASGLIKGGANNLVLNAKLNTSYGAVNAKGYINNFKVPDRAVYDLDLQFMGFHLGHLLSMDSVLGAVTGTVKAKGRGFDYKTMQSDLAANLDALFYNGYTYNNIFIDANFNRGSINSKGNVDDENLRMYYTMQGNVQGTYPSIAAQLRVDTIRLQPLNLYNDTLNASFTASIDARDTRPRNLDLNVIIDSTFLQAGLEKFYVDSMVLAGSSANGVDDITFTAPFAYINANGAFDYDKVGASLTQYINHYYKIAPAPPGPIADQQMVFEGHIAEHPLVKYAVPGLYDYDSINFSGSYSSALRDSALRFNIDFPYLHYTDFRMRNGNIAIGSRNEQLNYDVNFDTLHFKANTFYGSKINGYAANDSLSINALTQDNNRKDWFGVKASVAIDNETYNLSLRDNLLLNYETWNVAPDNLISWGRQGWYVNNFVMRSDTASISINSQQPVVNSPINLVVDNFNLKSISALVSTDTLLASGILDANFVISDLQKSLPGFTGNAEIQNFELKQQPIGNITAALRKESENVIAGEINLTGFTNDVKATGKYYLNNTEQEFDANLDIKRLTLSTLQAFSAGFIRNGTGTLQGNVAMNGKFADPRWNGQLSFDTARFTLSEYGSVLLIDDQQINLAYPNINFNNFTILDSLGHQLKINGIITSRRLNLYDLNLDISANDFVLINTRSAVNNQIYGYGSVDADIRITGSSRSPNLEGNVLVNDGSDLTIVLPERSFSKDEALTVVRFIDRDTFAIDPPKSPFEPEKEPLIAFAQYLNYNFNLEITKNSTLRIIVDPATGDNVRVQGDAQLNAGVDPGGNLILAGNFEADNGEYELNYQFLQRKFNLVKGSSISFGGEPMNARVNITAEYIANTSARDLINNEVTDINPALATSFRQKIPFRVILYLTGELSRPTINFDIQLPEESNLITGELRTTIENKLIQLRGDQSAINKQVFSLLLLNRFVGEQSSDFFKGNDADFSDLARQSVSQFLSAALNEIAANLFTGIDIDLNLNSYRDYSYGGGNQRTDLNVTLSKTFMDDRLTVSVGTNIGIEGDDPAAKAGSNSNSFMPDVTLAYKLTKDGKYMIRAYRRNQFEVVMDGYVVENGLSFVVTMDYEKFRELFRSKKASN